MMAQLLLIFASLVTFAASKSSIYYHLEDAEVHFENFIKEHGKQYFNDEQKADRFEIFKENLERANELNQQSEHTEFGITQFSDLTPDEFAEYASCLPPALNLTDLGSSCSVVTDTEVPHVQAPESHDWRQYNVVSRVKNQGQCGSCYSFSATGNIEGQYAIQHQSLMELSQQQIIDCDRGSNGCHGGYMTSAFSSIIQLGGIETESNYPYAGRQQVCQYQPQKAAIRLTACTQYNLRSQEKLKQILFQTGPLAIAVKATNFQSYRGGVMRDDVCNVGQVNHAILLVGYGIENGVPYWLAKNSWAESFGERGYIKFQRGEGHDSCGVMNSFMASSTVM